jgi:hypothetical protein
LALRGAMTRARSDIALNVAQRCPSRKRYVLRVARANNVISLCYLFCSKI